MHPYITAQKGQKIFEKSFLGSSPLGFHRVAYTEWGRWQALPPVICAHGLTRNGRDFDRLAEALAERTQVLCPDIAGRGKSDYLKDPSFYTYAQYLADMTALIARVDAPAIDWVGTSMGGIIGMYLAAADKTPIRRLVINDVGPFIPVTALKRIADYAGMMLEFNDLAQAARHLRTNYAPFGITREEDWRAFTEHSVKRLPNGKWAFTYDSTIAQNFKTVTQDVDFWNVYDRIKCPVLLLRGACSDVLPAEIAQEMTRRGPKAKLVEFPGVGHAPALLDEAQISVIQEFLVGQ